LNGPNTPDELTVSPASPHDEDARRLLERLSAELAALYGDDGSGAFAPDDVRVPGAAFVLARWHGLAVGCGALRPLEEDVAEVKRMFVEPAYRGRGIARRVLAVLEAQARTFGYRVVRLETGVRQPVALRLYEAAGYRRIDCYGRYATDPLSVCFEKGLA
jgi:GNAT superfamily N-acetyltransferase